MASIHSDLHERCLRDPKGKLFPPSTIGDPAITDEVRVALPALGYPKQG